MTISPEIFTSVINSYLPEPQASLLNGIIFGTNLHTSQQFYSNLKIVGLLHLVVLSGMNINLLAAITTRLLSYFSIKINTLITILIIILFIIFVGLKAPIVRAGFTSILTFVALIYGRKTLPIYILFISFFLIICIWPEWIKSISLYLSYGATLGLILFGGHSTQPTKTSSLFQTLRNYFFTELRTSLAAQIFTTPLIFIYFKQISIISPFSNIFVSWLIAPLMIFGFLTALLGKINFTLGIIPAYICYGLLTYMTFIIETFASLPFVFFQF